VVVTLSMLVGDEVLGGGFMLGVCFDVLNLGSPVSSRLVWKEAGWV
jgi:hypothetical protein